MYHYFCAESNFSKKADLPQYTCSISTVSLPAVRPLWFPGWSRQRWAIFPAEGHSQSSLASAWRQRADCHPWQRGTSPRYLSSQSRWCSAPHKNPHERNRPWTLLLNRLIMHKINSFLWWIIPSESGIILVSLTKISSARQLDWSQLPSTLHFTHSDTLEHDVRHGCEREERERRMSRMVKEKFNGRLKFDIGSPHILHSTAQSWFHSHCRYTLHTHTPPDRSTGYHFLHPRDAHTSHCPSYNHKLLLWILRHIHTANWCKSHALRGGYQ